MVDQLPLRVLLSENQIYRKWFKKQPKLRVQGNTDPWRLFAQKHPGGPWAKKDYPGYPEAYDALRLRLPKYYDMTIHSKRQHYPPPQLVYQGRVVHLPMPPGHIWCELCRRPVTLGRFEQHPNISMPSSPEWLRCQICGMRQVAMREYPSPLSYQLTRSSGSKKRKSWR